MAADTEYPRLIPLGFILPFANTPPAGLLIKISTLNGYPWYNGATGYGQFLRAGYCWGKPGLTWTQGSFENNFLSSKLQV